MIELKKLFSFVEGIDSEQAKKFMAEHPEGSYTLLDVRQPSEYEAGTPAREPNLSPWGNWVILWRKLTRTNRL